LVILKFVVQITMENGQLTGQEIVFSGQCGSSLQVSGDSSLINEKSVEFLAEKDDASFSEDDASISEFKEENEIDNQEDQLEIEDVDPLEAKKENEKKSSCSL